MIHHIRRALGRILCVLTVVMLGGERVRAQKDVDRELARAMEGWKEGTPIVRLRALERLDALYSDAAPAVPLLVAALRDPDHVIRAKRPVF